MSRPREPVSRVPATCLWWADLSGGRCVYRHGVPVRLTRLSDADLAERLTRLDAGDADTADLRALTKHYLGLLVARAPGNSVEVRVPPYAAVQCVAGSRHTRGTPPAVVETDPLTWLALSRGRLAWDDARADGRVSASGERSDLAELLPLG